MAAGAMSGAAAGETLASSGMDEALSQVGNDAVSASLDQGDNAMATGATETAQVGSDALAQQLDQQAMGQVASNTASAPVTANQMPMDNSAVATAADAGVANPMTNGVQTPNDQFNVSADLRDWGGAQKQSSGSFFDYFKDTKPDTLLNLGGNVLGGVAKGYEADRNYQLGKDQLGLIQQKMNWGNSTPKYNFKA